MKDLGFVPCTYDAIKRTLAVDEISNSNTVFVRDPEEMLNRLKAARHFQLINGQV
jgi:hypothetical protein